MVLVAPSPRGNLPGAHAIAAVDETSLRMPPRRAEVLDRFLGGHDGPHVATCMQRLCPESPRALNQRYRLSVPVDPTRIAAPVLVIETGLDRGDRHPPGQVEALSRFFGGEFAHIASAPHCMMLVPASAPALDLIVAWHARAI